MDAALAYGKNFQKQKTGILVMKYAPYKDVGT